MSTDRSHHPFRKRARALAGITMVAALALVSCSSSDDTSAPPSGSGSASSGSGADFAGITGPAPGVTADTIKIGVTYPDTKALEAVGLNFNLGDFEGAYKAIADDINSNGGINGRKLQLVFAPIDPTSPQPATDACVKLTEDDDVFLIVGFFLNDAPLCPTELHETGVIGGGMTPDRLSRAQAPWLTPLVDSDLPEQVTQEFVDRGLLNGKVALFAAVGDKEELDNHVATVLQKAGITPVETGIMDAPDNDTAAIQASVKTIAEKFKSAGADTVLIAGASGADWPIAMADDTSYRPKLLFVDSIAMQAFATNQATTDTSILNGSFGGGIFGPNKAIFDDANMQKCVKVITATGIDVPGPSAATEDPSNQPFQAAFAACPHMDLLKAWLEAAGQNLNYGTLQAAVDKGFELAVSGDPSVRKYGPPPAGDGNPDPYIFAWDESTKSLVQSKG